MYKGLAAMNRQGFIKTFLAVMLLGVTAAFAEQPQVKYITCEELSAAMSSGSTVAASLIVADVRAAEDFYKGHIKGAVSVPFNTIATANWSKDAAIVLYCSGVGCPLSGNSAAQLMQAGYINVKVLRGGFSDWQLRGYPVENGSSGAAPKVVCGLIQPVALDKLIKSGAKAVIFDTRPATEYSAGHITGAQSVPLEGFIKAFPAVPSGSVAIVVDRLPARAQQACEAAARAGASVQILSGGISVWSALGYPITTGGGNGG